ncbi:MAG: hypothetical protein ACK55Z_09205, partial [bacterium]
INSYLNTFNYKIINKFIQSKTLISLYRLSGWLNSEKNESLLSLSNINPHILQLSNGLYAFYIS